MICGFIKSPLHSRQNPDHGPGFVELLICFKLTKFFYEIVDVRAPNDGPDCFNEKAGAGFAHNTYVINPVLYLDLPGFSYNLHGCNHQPQRKMKLQLFQCFGRSFI